MNRPQVLMLLPETPAAAGSGGQVRIYHFVKAAAQVADVTLVVLTEPDAGEIPEELDVVGVIRPGIQLSSKLQSAGPASVLKVLISLSSQHGRSLMMAGQNICVSRASGGRLSWFHRLYGWLLLLQASILNRFAWLFPVDIHVRGSCWDQIEQDLDHVGFEPDIVWYEHSYLYPLKSMLSQRYPAAQVVVNAHNLEWLLKESIARTTPKGLAQKWTQLESRLMERWETRMISESALIYVCSEEDKRRLIRKNPDGQTEIVVIPNGVDVDYFVPGIKQADTPTLLFAGTAGYPPNDDAVDWLASDIFPEIRKQNPKCQLVLAGRNADQHWGHLHSPDDAIEVAANVPDMRPLLARAWVSVVPLRSGSGTRLKIVEAMSAGRCVVSTSIGAEGLNLTSDTDLIIRDNADEFADAVVALLNDSARRTSFEIKGRQVACERFSWRLLANNAAELFRQSVQSRELISVD